MAVADTIDKRGCVPPPLNPQPTPGTFKVDAPLAGTLGSRASQSGAAGGNGATALNYAFIAFMAFIAFFFAFIAFIAFIALAMADGGSESGQRWASLISG